MRAKPAFDAVDELFSRSPDGLREIVRAVMQEMLEAEMTDSLGAEKGERTTARLAYRFRYDTRTLVTRGGKLELRVPQDRDSPPSSSCATGAPSLAQPRNHVKGPSRCAQADPRASSEAASIATETDQLRAPMIARQNPL
jgi:hypothetical protein